MALKQLLGGPDWDVIGDFDSALFADFHYFFNSGSVIRSNPWDSPVAPVAKILNVKNITADDVALNYVGTAGTIIATTLTSGSTTQITSQTLPLGLDNSTAWLSASFVSNFTGSVTARPTGSRYFELDAIRTISQQTYLYTIQDGDTTPGRDTLSFPVSGSSKRYTCSRTIPFLTQPFWLIRDLAGCPGGTTTTTSTTTTTAGPTTTTTTTAGPTTTTTAGPTTTTTTTTLASQKYLITSCIGDGDIIGIFTITNAPLLAPGDGIRINGGIAGYYCFYVNNTSTGTSLGTYSITNIYRGVPCDNCSE
jgi:hypothetical protein